MLSSVRISYNKKSKYAEQRADIEAPGASRAENVIRLLGKCSQLPLSPYRYTRGTGQGRSQGEQGGRDPGEN